MLYRHEDLEQSQQVLLYRELDARGTQSADRSAIPASTDGRR
jgi:hypothetical protein